MPATLRPPIAVTMGEPAGVGGELALKSWVRRRPGDPVFFVIDHPRRLRTLAARLALPVPVEAIAVPADAHAVMARALPVLAPASEDFGDAAPGHPTIATAHPTMSPS